ncbi:MAG: sugar phosphate isomerase/epimerase [Oscillospiraceae bacterium]|nr:sugar phosphate isomerase/epimerase [Oscillospiraceae bacterium]
MQAAVSTACLFPKPTEDALYDLCLAGVQNVEIFLNSPSEASPVYIQDLREICNRFGAACIAVHPWTAPSEGHMLFSAYTRRYTDFLEQAKHIFEATATLGAAISILHGAQLGTCKNIAFYCERFAALAELGKQFGITVTQENVHRYESQNLKFLKEFCRILGDEAAITFDVKQAVRAGMNPMEAIQSIGKHIAHIHLSDHGPLGDCLRIGKGRFSVVPFFTQLHRIGYQGDITLELYREAFDSVQDLSEDWQRINRLIARSKP